MQTDVRCETMKKIGQEMRCELPNKVYREFVSRYILHWGSEQASVDPFALEVSDEKFEDTYVGRERVEQEIKQPGDKIFIGPEGSGKTTLLRKLPDFLGEDVLIVQLPPVQRATPISRKDLMAGEISLLTAEALVPCIFDAYWKHLLLDDRDRERCLPVLRQNREWMTDLRWFYQQYPPVRLQVTGDFELMTWLNVEGASEPVNSDAGGEEVLRELIRFVVPRPYTQIQILVDVVEHLSPQAITRLLQDVQRLHELHLQDVSFKVFADSALRDRIEEKRCVKQGYVPISCLPSWREKELRQILLLRLNAWRKGEFADYNWGRSIINLKPAARSKFVEIVTKGALRAHSFEKEEGAPTHALRLARGLVAACAGCWKDHYEPPLNIAQLEDLVECYWKAKGEEAG